MFDFVISVFQFFWNIIATIVSFVLQILASLIYNLFNLIVHLYTNLISNYPGLALFALAASWLIFKRWDDHNKAIGAMPKEIWENPAIIVIASAPIIIPVLSYILITVIGLGGFLSEFSKGLYNPLIGIAVALVLFFISYSALVKFGVIQPSPDPSLLKLMIHYSFVITLSVVTLGFGLAAYEVYVAPRAQAAEPLK